MPIYIHPHLPPEPVRQAYYSDLQPGAGRVLEFAAWGWHSETAIHVLRMVLAGMLDRHPRLRLVIGHMGEMLPVMLARIDEVSALDIEHLKRPISRAILDQVWLTTSGIFSEPPFLAALLTFGIDRIMFSVDYPYAPNAKGRDFLDGISLAPADMAKLTHSNADALLKLKVGEYVASARDTVVELHFVIADVTVRQNVKRGAADCDNIAKLPELLLLTIFVVWSRMLAAYKAWRIAVNIIQSCTPRRGGPRTLAGSSCAEPGRRPRFESLGPGRGSPATRRVRPRPDQSARPAAPATRCNDVTPIGPQLRGLTPLRHFRDHPKGALWASANRRSSSKPTSAAFTSS